MCKGECLKGSGRHSVLTAHVLAHGFLSRAQREERRREENSEDRGRRGDGDGRRREDGSRRKEKDGQGKREENDGEEKGEK